MNATINGINLEDLHLVWLQGSIDNLLKPAELKPLVLNENASIDGSRCVMTDRRVKSRDVTLNFRIKGFNQQDLMTKVNDVVSKLAQGKDNSGVNELHLIDYGLMFRLVYLKCNKYTSFGTKSALISFTFKELNPNNRNV